MEIVWDVPEKGRTDRKDQKEQQIESEDEPSSPAEVESLTTELKEWKRKADLHETRARLMERNWHEATEKMREITKELEEAIEEINRLRAELKKPSWQRKKK